MGQVKAGTVFDNIIITDDIAEAEAFMAETYGKTKDAEKAMFDDIEKKKREEEEAERKLWKRSAKLRKTMTMMMMMKKMKTTTSLSTRSCNCVFVIYFYYGSLYHVVFNHQLVCACFH